MITYNNDNSEISVSENKSIISEEEFPIGSLIRCRQLWHIFDQHLVFNNNSLWKTTWSKWRYGIILKYEKDVYLGSAVFVRDVNTTGPAVRSDLKEDQIKVKFFLEKEISFIGYTHSGIEIEKIR